MKFQMFIHAIGDRGIRTALDALQYAREQNGPRDSRHQLVDVAEMDALVGIYTALTRKGLDGQPPGGWIPDQTIDLETALRAYTIQGAYANFAEQNRGSLAPGNHADLIILSDNLFEMPPDKV